MAFPPMKAPATLRMKPGPGRPSPSAGEAEGTFMSGAFGDLAYLLAHVEPLGGDEFWIESTTGVFNRDEVKTAFEAGAIQQVN